MGEPFKDQDPEKGNVDAPRPSISEGIGNMLSKAGEGFTRGMTKTAEGIHTTGSTLKDSAKSAGAMVAGLGGAGKTPQKKKNNPGRAKQAKKVQKSIKSVPQQEPKDTNAVGNITKLLPANTFLMFQTLAPLATNDGNCGRAEVIMTISMLIILGSTCMLVCFTDTIQFNGKVYHGLVTPSGLWNPSFKGDPTFKDLRLYEIKLAHFYEARNRYKADKREARKDGLPVPARPEEPPKPVGPHVMGSTYSSGNSQYQLNFTDFLHAILSVMAFGTLTMLTNPVSTCFYPDIPSTVVKTLPLLVGFVISAIFAFSPPARNGIAHPLSPKVPSSSDKPADPRGVVHGPMLPPQPPGKGDHDAHGKPKPDDDDDDDLGGSVKKYLGRFFGSPDREKSPAAGEHHQAMDGVKALASGFFSKYGDDLKEGAAKMVHNLEGEVKKEASHMLLKAAPAVAELSKDIHVPLALQEAAKSMSHEALVAGLVNAGAHPALAIAAVQSAAQSAKDAALNEFHQELQSAKSAPLAALTKQSSMVLTRANSMLESAGSSLSSQSVHDGLFHQAAQVLQRQVSGLPPNVQSAGPEAAALAYATGQALLQAGYQFPGGGQSPQAAALSAFSQGVGNLNLNAANALVKDATSLYQQGSKSLAEVHDELARQGAALSQGFQSSSFSFPASSPLANSGSQAAQGTFAATLAAGMAREAGMLLQEGADNGMAGVHAEIARQKAAAMQPVTSLAQQGSAEFLKQKEAWTQEMNSQARALSAPATSVAHDIAALAGSQPTVSSVNSQFLESLALGVAQGMSTQMAHQFQQPAASVAIDVSQMQAQLARQASAVSPQALSAAASMLQRQGSFGQFQQPSAQQVADTRMALRHFASQLSAQPASSSAEFGAFQASSPPSWRDNASLIIEEVTDAAAAGQRGVERLQRGASQLPSVTEEAVAHAPSASQVRTASSDLVESTSEAAGQAALASMTRILRSDRPESTEIMDAISTEEITSESETELSNRGEFRGGAGSSTFNLQKKKS